MRRQNKRKRCWLWIKPSTTERNLQAHSETYIKCVLVTLGYGFLTNGYLGRRTADTESWRSNNLWQSHRYFRKIRPFISKFDIVRIQFSNAAQDGQGNNKKGSTSKSTGAAGPLPEDRWHAQFLPSGQLMGVTPQETLVNAWCCRNNLNCGNMFSWGHGRERAPREGGSGIQ